MLSHFEEVECTEPNGALYVFPKLGRQRFNIVDDERFVPGLLRR